MAELSKSVTVTIDDSTYEVRFYFADQSSKTPGECRAIVTVLGAEPFDFAVADAGVDASDLTTKTLEIVRDYATKTLGGYK